MAIHVNETRIRGNVGKNAELRYNQKGVAFASFSVATRPRRKNRDSGDWEDGPTEWHQITCMGALAERMAKQAQKGTLVDITGRLTYDSYTRDGENRPRTVAKIWARDAQVMNFQAQKEPSSTPASDGDNEEIPFPAPPED